MAKAKTLAALAGLAGLAYAMRNKGESKTDTGDETERLKARKPAEEEKRRQITDYMKKAPEAEDANYGNEGRRTSMGVAPASKTRSMAAPKPIADNVTAAAVPSGIMGGASEDLQNYKSPSTASSSAEGMKNYVPRRKPPVSTASSSEEGMEMYKPRRPVPPLRPAGMKKGGMTSSASSRADGIATKGKTRGKIC